MAGTPRTASPAPGASARLRRSVLDGTAPVLMDAAEVLAALDIRPGSLAHLERTGQPENMTLSGTRKLYRTAAVRQLLTHPRRTAA